jgi:hypothetical protein
MSSSVETGPTISFFETGETTCSSGEETKGGVGEITGATASGVSGFGIALGRTGFFSVSRRAMAAISKPIATIVAILLFNVLTLSN